MASLYSVMERSLSPLAPYAKPRTKAYFGSSEIASLEIARFGFAFQNVLYILTPSHLRIGGLKTVLQFAFTYEGTCQSKCIPKIRCAAQRSIKKGVTEVGPLVSVFAAKG